MRHTITAADWKKTHRDFKLGSPRRSDARVVVFAKNAGSVLVPVNVVKEMSEPCACVHCGAK